MSATITQRRLKTFCEDERNARAASRASVAYTVKCPVFRTIRLMTDKPSSLMPGVKIRTTKPSQRDVLEAETSSPEPKTMTAIHNRSGAYRHTRDPARLRVVDMEEDESRVLVCSYNGIEICLFTNQSASSHKQRREAKHLWLPFIQFSDERMYV